MALFTRKPDDKRCMEAANDAPEVRPEAVARGKALLESGKLGSDPARLADKMIDSLLDQ